MSREETRIIQRRLDLIRWTFEIEDCGTYINIRWRAGPSIGQVRDLLGEATEARLPGARGRGLPASGQGTGRAGGQAGRPFVLGRSNNGKEVSHVQQS